MTTMPVVPTGAVPTGAVPVNITPRWNTLRILKVSRMVIIALVALLLVAVIVGTTVHRDAMKTVGKDAAPSIIAAQHIKAALADMDADAAKELLSPATRESATYAFERRRTEADDAMIAAAENITFGGAEREPIEALIVGTGSYERLVQKARDLHDSGAGGEVAAYRAAAQLMDQGLLPSADALDRANNDVLERTYEAQTSKSLAARALIAVTGLLVLLAFAMAQGFLSYRTRRTLNPLLLLATIMAAGLTVYSMAAMGDERHELKVAKEDAFASIRALWRARAVAYQANGEEGRYLLDTVNAKADEEAFTAESGSLATLPSTLTTTEVLTSEANGHSVNGFTGLLADELNNITFDREREAAVATLDDFEKYETVDAEMRTLERGGRHKQAVETWLGQPSGGASAQAAGQSAGQSGKAFERFDAALGKTLQINQRAFDDSVEKGLSGLSGLEVKSAVVAVVIAALTFLGLAGRIREYE